MEYVYNKCLRWLGHTTGVLHSSLIISVAFIRTLCVFVLIQDRIQDRLYPICMPFIWVQGMSTGFCTCLVVYPHTQRFADAGWIRNILTNKYFSPFRRQD